MASGAPAGEDGLRGADGDRPALVPLPLTPRQRARIRHIPANEIIYARYFAHGIVFLRSLRRPLIPFLLLVGLLLVLNLLDPATLPDWLQGVLSVGGILLTVAFVVVVAWIIYLVVDWRSDHLIITGQRVVLNIETPAIRRVLRDVPMGKIQNVVTHTASIDHPVDKVLGVARLVIDTAGLGQITFKDMRERDAHEATQIILAVQGGVLSASRSNRESYRQAVIDSILYGKPMPQRPQRVEILASPRTGDSGLNLIFPFQPWREGLRVIWHRHWWFLLRKEAVPVLAFLVYEVTALLITWLSNVLGILDNPVLGALNIIRPLVYLAMLPAMIWQWADWRNDQFILDKDRLMTVEQRPLGFSRTVKQTEIRRVVDATVSVQGAMPNILRFGDVVMKTPGEATEFLFAGVPRPFQVHHEISRRIEADREREQGQVDRDVQEWLRSYVEARRAEPSPAPPPVDPPFWAW